MKYKLLCCPVLIFSSLVLTDLAFAETELPTVTVSETREEKSSYDAPTATTATKTKAMLRDIPQTVNVVPQAVIQDQNALSLQDVLRNVPGVSFSVGDAHRDQVTIRGFITIYDQYVDGVRDDAMYYRDVSNIERVEVLKGPASVLFGRGSPGGLINRVTKKPAADPIRDITLTAGTDGQRRGEFDVGVNTSQDPVQFRLTGAVEDSTSFRKQYFLERQSIGGAALLNISDDTKLTIQADYLHDKRLADQGIPGYKGRPVAVPIETYFGSAAGKDQTYITSIVKSATATLDHRIGNDLSFHSVLRTYDFWLNRNYTTNSVNTAAKKLTISRNTRFRDESGTYWQNELAQTAQLGGIKHEILYGVELGRQNKAETLYSLKNAATYDLFNPVLAVLPPIPAGTKAANDNTTRVEIAGLYLQDLVSLSPQWKLLAGARFDSLRQTRDDRTAANLDLARSDRTISPRLGLVYQPIEPVSFYASYNRSFQPLVDAFTFKRNTDELKPTQTENLEVGSKFDISSRASATLSIFQMTQSNIQVADPANPDNALPIGRQRTRGMELTFSGQLAPSWSLIAGYAYLDGKIIESTEKTSDGSPFQGKTSSLTPRHSMNVWLKHDLPNGIYIAGGVRAEGARFASADDQLTLPGYAVVDVGAGYRGKEVDLTLTAGNVLNRQYFISGHSGANDYNMPGTPRNVLLAMRWKV